MVLDDFVPCSSERPARFSPGCCCTACSNGQVACNFIGSMRWNNFGAGRKLDICHFQQGMWFLVCGVGGGTMSRKFRTELEII